MSKQPDTESIDRQKLRHDLRNDIGSLRMNLEAIQLSRDEPEVHQELVELMLGTVSELEGRIGETMTLLCDDGSESLSKS